MQPASLRHFTPEQYLKIVLDLAAKRGFRVYAAENATKREDFEWTGREIGAPLIEAWHDRACAIALEASDGWIYLRSQDDQGLHMLRVRALPEGSDVVGVIAGYPGQLAEVISLAILRTERPIDPATVGEDAGR